MKHSGLLLWHERDRDPPGCLRAVIRAAGSDESAAPWAVALDRSIASPDLPSILRSASGRVVVGCAPALPQDGHGQDAPGEPAARSFGAWGPRGRQALANACERAATIGRERGVTVCLVPHASGLVSDVPSCVALLRHWTGAPIALLLDPAALVSRSMEDLAPEHLGRIGEALLSLGGVAGVLVRSTREPELAETAPGLLASFAQAARRAGIPVIVPADEASAWADRIETDDPDPFVTGLRSSRPGESA